MTFLSGQNQCARGLRLISAALCAIALGGACSRTDPLQSVSVRDQADAGSGVGDQTSSASSSASSLASRPDRSSYSSSLSSSLAEWVERGLETRAKENAETMAGLKAIKAAGAVDLRDAPAATQGVTVDETGLPAREWKRETFTTFDPNFKPQGFESLVKLAVNDALKSHGSGRVRSDGYVVDLVDPSLHRACGAWGVVQVDSNGTQTSFIWVDARVVGYDVLLGPEATARFESKGLLSLGKRAAGAESLTVTGGSQDITIRCTPEGAEVVADGKVVVEAFPSGRLPETPDQADIDIPGIPQLTQEQIDTARKVAEQVTRDLAAHTADSSTPFTTTSIPR